MALNYNFIGVENFARHFTSQCRVRTILGTACSIAVAVVLSGCLDTGSKEEGDEPQDEIGTGLPETPPGEQPPPEQPPPEEPPPEQPPPEQPPPEEPPPEQPPPDEPPPPETGLKYLDDANPPASAAVSDLPSVARHGFPRIHILEVSTDISAQMLSKYQFVDAHGSGFDKLRSAQEFSPDMMVLRHISGRAYQSYAYAPCSISGGVAFDATGPVSQGGPSSKGCAIYAGHWLYRAGSPLTAAINAATTTLRVKDAARFAVGQFVVIYDAPAGSFENAEHAKVTGRNLSNNTLTLQSRGFKSPPRSHNAGAIVAQHVLGQGTSPELWAWNMSTQCPRDGAGKTFAQFYADWLAVNLSRYKSGADSGVNVAGVVFDADFYFEPKPNQADANNDLVRDDAFAGDGTNWLGDGIDNFYALVRARLPNKYILAGTPESRGFGTLNGTQMESWLDYGNGSYDEFSGDPKYPHINSLFSMYLFNMSTADNRQQPLVHNLTKTATRRYPGKANPPPANNRPARLALALTLMDDGYYGTHSRYTPDAWWDEYAVDLTPGAASYGEAMGMYSANAVRSHTGWLGKPTGKFRRIYDNAVFAPEHSLLENGTFDANIAGWTGTRVDVHRITDAFDGAGALRAGKMNPYTETLTAAQIKGPRLALRSGGQYTIALVARASHDRTIRIDLGSFNDRFIVGTDWRRYVMSFQQDSTETKPLSISVGREDTSVDIDSIYVFEGNANVFRRDFEHGIALANATPTTQTVDLGGTYRKIKGKVDPVANDGATVTSVSLPPYDGLLLIGPQDSTN